VRFLKSEKLGREGIIKGLGFGIWNLEFGSWVFLRSTKQKRLPKGAVFVTF